jgi:hypothetical protein
MALTKVDTSMVESSGAFGRRNILINGDYSIYQRAQQVAQAWSFSKLILLLIDGF